MKIQSIKAIEVLDSRGKPTLRTFITLEDGTIHSASVPSGSSKGTHEAVELRDYNPKRYLGFGVTNAIMNVNSTIAEGLLGMDIETPERLDQVMIEMDGSDSKSKLGANAILSVSMAAVRAAAHVAGVPLWKYINQYFFTGHEPQFPRLMANIINGGKHANWNFDIQEFMVCPLARNPSESVRVASEIFLRLGQDLKRKNMLTLVGDEGGYSPPFKSNEEVFDSLLDAATTCGYQKMRDYFFAVDCAASEFYEGDKYIFKKTNETLTRQQLTEYYSKLGQKYNIQSFEDPFAEDDWDAFVAFKKLADDFQFQIVGDDLFCTDPKLIAEGIEKNAVNAVLIKPNQIGSVSETIKAIKMTRGANWKVVISHRSGETEDTFIADLAYGCGADFIKTGSLSRSERLCKYNRLLEIEAGF